MTFFKCKPELKMNQVPSDGVPGGAPPSPPQPQTPATPPAPPSPPTPQTQGNPGETPPAPPSPGAPVPPAEASKPQPPATPPAPPAKKEDGKSLSGYDENPPKAPADPAAPEVPPGGAVPAAPPAAEPGSQLNTEGLEPADIARITELAKVNNLTPKDAQVLADFRKAQISEGVKALETYKTQQEIARQQTIVNWHKELADDPTFGGKNFGQNLKRVDQVLDQYFPATRKMLTERGSVLPPYVMRDLAMIGDTLLATGKLTTGDVPVPPPVKKEHDPLDFYAVKK